MRRDGDGREGWEVAASETGCEGPCLNSELASWDFEGNCVLVITHTLNYTHTHTFLCPEAVQYAAVLVSHPVHVTPQMRDGATLVALAFRAHTHTLFVSPINTHPHLPRCGAPAALHTLPTTQCSRRAYRIKLKLVTPP